jgi:hypothetical protein
MSLIIRTPIMTLMEINRSTGIANMMIRALPLDRSETQNVEQSGKFLAYLEGRLKGDKK